MSNDDGGPGTSSSSVRRSRYSRGVFADARPWLGVGFRLLLAAAAARLGADFRLLAAAFLFFRVVVPVVLVVLVVLVFRRRVFGRLAERRFAGDFLLAFALLLP
jgi:hypothetical protein